MEVSHLSRKVFLTNTLHVAVGLINYISCHLTHRPEESNHFPKECMFGWRCQPKGSVITLSRTT